MKYAWSGKGKNIFLACLTGMSLFFLSGCDFGPERPNEGFFYYTGFRDWWRIPLVYPFQIQVIDCFDSGSFTRHKIPSLVAHSESTQLLSEITAFCDYGNYWLFKGTESFSVFHIATEKITHFGSGEELERFLVSQKLSTPEWKDLKTLYNERWRLADKVRQNPALGFWTQRKNSYGMRFPLKMPWQVILTDSNVYIGKYDPQQAYSRRKVPLEWEKMVENISLIHYERTFAAFKQKDGEKTYGCLIYASGDVDYFTTLEELNEFVTRNYVDIAPLELVEPVKLHDMMWKAIDKIKRTDPKTLPVD